jgi:hypothetical protein
MLRLFHFTISPYYPPINTVGAPGGRIVPPDAVTSNILAAGKPPMRTVIDPFAITSAPHESPTLAAGSPPISTVGAPGGIMGTGIPFVAVLTIMSLILAAGNIVFINLSEQPLPELL